MTVSGSAHPSTDLQAGIASLLQPIQVAKFSIVLRSDARTSVTVPSAELCLLTLKPSPFSSGSLITSALVFVVVWYTSQGLLIVALHKPCCLMGDRQHV